MPIFRLIAIALLAWIAYMVLKNFLRKARPLPKQAHAEQFTKVLRCQHCGVHIPENQAVLRDGNTFCCEEHSR